MNALTNKEMVLWTHVGKLVDQVQKEKRKLDKGENVELGVGLYEKLSVVHNKLIAVVRDLEQISPEFAWSREVEDTSTVSALQFLFSCLPEDHAYCSNPIHLVKHPSTLREPPKHDSYPKWDG